MIVLPDGVVVDPIWPAGGPADQLSVAYYTPSGLTWEWVDDEEDILAHFMAYPECVSAIYRGSVKWEIFSRSGWVVH